jgi:ribose 5-phosphate isomerase B
MKIAIGCDHGGDNLRPIIAEYLQELGHDVIEYSPNSGESTDYPQYGKMVAEDVVANRVEAGILICGTDVGISIAANKVKGIRAVVCSEPATARLSKQHNNTNILAFGEE